MPDDLVKDPCAESQVHQLLLTWNVALGGSLVYLSPFVRRVVGSNPALVATQGHWASPSLAVESGASAWNFDTASVLSHIAVSGAPRSSSGLEEARGAVEIAGMNAWNGDKVQGARTLSVQRFVLQLIGYHVSHTITKCWEADVQRERVTEKCRPVRTGQSTFGWNSCVSVFLSSSNKNI